MRDIGQVDAWIRQLDKALPRAEVGDDDDRPPWRELARTDQLIPDDAFFVWLILAGRGWGKTRTGAETVHEWATEGDPIRIAIAAPTAADIRDVCVEGESGLCTLYPSLAYEPSKRRITWPNGSTAILLSADEPKRFRGPQYHKAWVDELAAWRYPEAWDQLTFGLRLGDKPQAVVTTTPKPTRIIRDLMASDDTHTTRGSTFDNAANLSAVALQKLRDRYEGTRLGRQELHAEVLTDVVGALWSIDILDRHRVTDAPPMRRVVVAIDPAATKTGDETGIVVAGVGEDGRGYVLEDGSGRFSPDGWAKKAIVLHDDHEADRIVAEVNQGGQMVEAVLRHNGKGSLFNYRGVHASRGKRTRAEPIAALYEQGKVSHVGMLPDLEEQLTTWDASDGSPSPDRLDALVWALTDLMRPSSPDAYRKAMRWAGGLPRRRM